MSKWILNHKEGQEWIDCYNQPQKFQETEWYKSGIIANQYNCSNAIVVTNKKNYNGSGKDAFGGAKDWPVTTLHVAFQTGEEEKREKFAEALKQFVDKFFGD